MISLSERHIGIEIEAETESFDLSSVYVHLQGPFASGNWEAERDHSLRGGRFGWEIKTAGDTGRSLGCVRTSMMELLPMLTHSTGTWRAAIHCHVDVRDFEPQKQALLLGFLYVLDDSLFERFSPARRESNFCVPLNNEVMRTLESMHMLDCNVLRGTMEDNPLCKYTSVNVLPVAYNMGTFEFRHMGTPRGSRSVGEVYQSLISIWTYAETCAELVQFVYEQREYQSIRDIAKLLSSEHTEALLSDLRLTVNQEALLNILDRFCSTAQKIPINVDTVTLYKASGHVFREARRPRFNLDEHTPSYEEMFAEAAVDGGDLSDLEVMLGVD